MNRWRIVNVMAVILGVTANVGCTVGEKKFACPGRPAGVHCMTTTEIYEATQNTDTVPPTADKAIGDDPRALSLRSDTKSKSKANRGANAVDPAAATNGSGARPGPTVPYPMVEKPVPVRVPARVMRVWIAPWSDSHDRLHGGEDAFVNVAEGHWVFGQSSTSVEPVRFFSLQPMSLESKGSVGKDQLAKSERAGLSERANASTTRPKKEPTDDSLSSEHTP